MKKLQGLAVVLAFLFMAFPSGQRPAMGKSPGQNFVLPTKVQAQADFGRMPLYFIANQGHLDNAVAYYAQGEDKTLYFTSEGVTIVLNEPRKNGEAQRGRLHNDDSPALDPIERWVVKLDFVGANPNVQPIGTEKTEATISYFKGKPKDWRTGLSTCARIVYPDLWPGIDLIYYGSVNRLKYEFVVHPGADPARVRLAYRGAEKIEVTADGRLVVTTPLGGFLDDIPLAYQEMGEKRKDVQLAYKIEKCFSANTIDTRTPRRGNLDETGEGPDSSSFAYSFKVGEYDRSLPLVLDPAILVHCGYIGGSSDDRGYGIAVDGSGNAYVTGYAVSTEASFPISTGPDLTHNGDYDAFVAKVNSSGTALLYCGFIGGSGDDRGYGIAVDGSGNAYVVGQTFSTEASFPVSVGPDLTHNGGYDAFVAKVSSSGTTLSYCGYVGGSIHDRGYGIAVDGPGNAYVTGHAASTEASFPVSVGPDLTHSGGLDAFVAKVSSSGTTLSYCGYIGGSGDDGGQGIAVDSSGNAYVVGQTPSTEASFPVSVGPDLTHNGGLDAFVAKVSSSGATLSYCGYIGGSGSDGGDGLAVDGSGSVYITGFAGSTEASFPVSVGPDLTHNGDFDAFVAKVSSSGTALLYCGYIGGSNWDEGRGIAVDGSGNAYIMGETPSTEASFPVSVGPDLSHNGSYDAFVAKVNSSGTALLYCGYIGGSSGDYGRGIALDISGNAYVTGYAASTEASFPVSVGPDLTHNGFNDAFVARVSFWDLWASKHAVGDFDGDGTDEAAVDFGTAGIYLYDNGSWTQLSGANPESLLAADVDGDNAAELLADLGASGLWLWNAGAWNQVSGLNVEGMAAGDVDADGADELVGDFGTVGMWLYNGGAWNQLSGVNADYIAVANLDGSGGGEIVGDFGASGLWTWNLGAWTQLSGVNADYVTFGDTNGVAGEELIGDFGPTGMWLWSLGSGWLQLSGVNADYIITADVDNNGDAEVFGDFAAAGLWQWSSGVWTQLSGVDADFMIRVDADGNGDDEVAGDFGALGLWLVNGSSWTQLSGVNAEYLMVGDMDGDNADEVMADFGALGLWLWNGGAWSQISASNPD